MKMDLGTAEGTWARCSLKAGFIRVLKERDVIIKPLKMHQHRGEV